jgi:carboxyl-terminal processing protease
MLDNGVGHLRIVSFTDSTDEEVEKALERFKKAGGTGLVLDLRNNPGGVLKAVVNVADQFIDDGLILYEINARGERTDWKAQPGGKGRDIPMVVLVNEFSASASEVLSGAIMDHQRALVIGTKTFGKGSVNTLRPLRDGSGIYFTVARWFTPQGTLIEGKGITPNIVLEPPKEPSKEGDASSSEDFVLEKAVDILNQQIARGS